MSQTVNVIPVAIVQKLYVHGIVKIKHLKVFAPRKQSKVNVNLHTFCQSCYCHPCYSPTITNAYTF